MKKESVVCKHVVKLKFTFGGPVTTKELQDAIGRALNTKQFRLKGQYTILETYEEKMEEVAEPKFRDPLATKPEGRSVLGPTMDWPASAMPLGPTSGGPA